MLTAVSPHSRVAKAESNTTPLSEAALQKEVKKLKDTDKDGSQTIIVSPMLRYSPTLCVLFS